MIDFNKPLLFSEHLDDLKRSMQLIEIEANYIELSEVILNRAKIAGGVNSHGWYCMKEDSSYLLKNIVDVAFHSRHEVVSIGMKYSSEYPFSPIYMNQYVLAIIPPHKGNKLVKIDLDREKLNRFILRAFFYDLKQIL